MKITIDINDNYAHILGKWASISRTLTESKNLLSDRLDILIEFDTKGKWQDVCERLFENIEELNQITQAIDHLHQMARKAIKNHQ